MATVFTIGYEGTSLRSFIATLVATRVEHVVDVRLTPISRKPGFSKLSLSRALQRRGISYSHYAQLGCPRDVRLRYRRSNDFEWYARRYAARVLERHGDDISRLGREARQRRVCLLCFEADPHRCHRSLVAAHAAELNRRALTVSHLVVPSSARTYPGP